MNSIKIKLSFIANLIAIFALIILGVVSFYFTKNSLYEVELNDQTNVLKVAENSLTNFRVKNIALIENLAKDILSLPYDKLNSQEALEENIGQMLKNYKHSSDLLAAYIGLDSGEALFSDSESDRKNLNVINYGKANNYNATQRDWYIQALKNKDVYVTPSYTDAITGKTVISYVKALYKDNKFIGVIGTDVLVHSLQKDFESQPGNAFLFDREGKIFVASNKELLQPNIDHTPVLNAYKTNGNYNFFSYKLNKEERLGICTDVFNYIACTTESADVINKPIIKAAYIQVITVIVMITISVILLYFIVSKYLSPLAAIQTGLTSFFDFI
ncbi:methyl-accepting chemotaxis protein, partial [Campylobacter jejuni]|nr:methyl-accepting chemotaxis protein [Campylobacter jejuni]